MLELLLYTSGLRRPVRSHELGLRIAYVEMMIYDAWPTSSAVAYAGMYQ